MRPSTELHDLIGSLTKSERRFFKLHCSLQAGDKNYMRIFDALGRQPHYDEEDLKRQFAGKAFVRHLPSEKNYLHKLVLKSLRAYHAGDSPADILRQEAQNIGILHDKGLYTECNKALHRAKKLARETEHFNHWAELLGWEKTLLEEALESGQFTKDIGILMAEEQGVLEKSRNLAAHQVLCSKINYVFRSCGYVRTARERAMVEEIGGHPLVAGRGAAMSRRAEVIRLHTRGLCHWAKRDWKASLRDFQRARRLLDANPAIRTDPPNRYLRVLHHIINARIELHDMAGAAEDIAYLRSLAGTKGFTGIGAGTWILTAGHLGELRLLDRSGRHDRAVELAGEVAGDLERMDGRVPKEHELELWFVLARAHFGAGRYNRALFWLNKVLNDNEPVLRQDIFTHARLFNLVVHYELGNFGLLGYIVRSTRRFLGRRQRALGVETLLIGHVGKLARATGPDARRSLFRSLHKRLATLLKDPDEGLVLKYFDVMAWATAHVEDVPFPEVVKRSMGGRRGR